MTKMVAQKKTWEQLETSALVKALERAAKQLNVRLTKAKLGQLVTLVGTLVGAGYNGWYMARLSEWGYYTYRELHINEKRELPERDADDDIPDAEVV